MKAIFVNEKPLSKKLNLLFLMAVFFFIPIQATPAYFFALFAIVAFIFTPDAWNDFKNALKHPLTPWFLAFFLIHPISLLWTENIEQGLWFINKYLIFLFFPLFLAMMKQDWISACIGSFLAGVALSETISYLLWFGLISFENSNSDHTAFVNHILYSPIVAFAAYIMLYQLIENWKFLPKWKKALILFFCFTIILNLFFTHGRTGMVAFAGLVLLLIWQQDTQHRLRNILFFIFGLPLLLALLYSFLPDFQMRADAAIQDILNFFEHNSGLGSINARLVMWIISIEISLDYWLLGVGIGDFEQMYKTYLEKSQFTALGTINPHNQYLLTASTTGVFGVIILFGILITAIKLKKFVNNQIHDLKVGLIALFAIIMLFESYFMRSNTALLWIFFTALFFSSDLNQRIKI